MSYTQLQPINNVSQIGYAQLNISYSNSSIPTTNDTEIGSVGLPIGVWFLQGSCTFPSSPAPAGTVQLSLSISKTTNSDPYYKQHCYASSRSTTLNITRMEVVNQNASYYLVAQDFALGRICTDIKFNAIRIA